MLEFSHNLWLVALSLAVILMAGFTGLSLTQGASKMAPAQRKLRLAMSAVSLGGGIWSMHFVAMLGLELPIVFFYDGLTTLISALVAVLMTGVALLVVHFGDRTPVKITLAGAIVGVGIPIMHYLGMSGMEMCVPVYSFGGVALSVAASLVLCIASFWLCYGDRRPQNIVLGTLGFAVSVGAVHFIAMAGTGFLATDDSAVTALAMSNEVLALVIAVASFAITGAFMLNSVTFSFSGAPVVAASEEEAADPESQSEDQAGDTAEVRVPFEQGGRIHFVAASDVAAIRAEGRYTFLYCNDERLFSPWSISEAEQQLKQTEFLRSHRGYLINARHVSSFERKKDTGVCYFETVAALDKAPVSRSYLPEVRKTLGV